MTNINIESLVRTCNDKKNVTTIPTSWMKCGEVFYDSRAKPVFVCLICLKNAENISAAYTTHDGSVFWWHIQQQHISEECESLDEISAEIESLETNNVETEMSVDSIHIDFGTHKVQQFHKNFIKSTTSSTATEKTKEIPQKQDSNIENDQIHENNLLTDDHKDDDATECATNLSDYNYYYDDSEIYTIPDDEEEFIEEDAYQAPPRIVGKHVRDYLRHNDMIVLSDDDEDNATIRSNSPILMNEITNINEDCEKPRVENNKYREFDNIENIGTQTNILANILTPDVSPCESLTAEQYNKRYNTYDEDIQEKQSHIMDVSPQPSLTPQQYNNNKEAEVNQVCTPDVSPCESITSEQYNNRNTPHNKKVQEKQVYTWDASPWQFLTSQQNNNRNIAYNKDAQEKQVCTPDLSPCESLTSEQYNNRNIAFNKDAREKKACTPDLLPCESPISEQYNNKNCAYNKDVQEKQICTSDSSLCQPLTADRSIDYNKDTQEKQICTLDLPPCPPLTTDRSIDYNKEAQEKQICASDLPPCPPLAADIKIVHNKEAQKKHVYTRDVSPCQFLTAQQCNNKNIANDKNTQEKQVCQPNYSPCKSIKAQQYNNIYNACSEGAKQKRDHSPHILTTDSLGAQQRRYSAQNKSIITEQPVPSLNVSPSDTLTEQHYNNRFNAYTENVQKPVHTTCSLPDESLAAQQDNNRYTAPNKSSPEARAYIPHISPGTPLPPPPYNNGFSAYTDNIQEQRAHIAHSSTGESLRPQPYNNRFGAYTDNMQESLPPPPYNNGFSAYTNNVQEQPSHIPHTSPGESLPPQPYNNRFSAYTDNVQEQPVLVPHVSPCESLLSEQSNNCYPAQHSITQNSQDKDVQQLLKTRAKSFRPFQCKFCGKRTITKKNMETHMTKFHQAAIHPLEVNRNNDSHYHQIPPSLINQDTNLLESNANQKPSIIECKICKTKTKSLKAMERHQKIYHSLETYFLTEQCPICHVRVLKDKLQKHKQLHSSDTLNCPYCGIACKRGYTLTNHMRKYHADKNTNSVPTNIHEARMTNVPTMSYEQQQFRYQEYEQYWRNHMNFNNIIPPQNPQW